MGDPKTKEREEILAAVRGELGEFGREIAEQMVAAREKLGELEDKVSKLPTTGAGGELRSKWGALLMGGDLDPSGKLSADEILDAAAKRANGGEKHDPRGLFGVRMMRAIAASSAVNNGRIDHDIAIGIARDWNDDRLAGALEETRDNIRALLGSDREAAKEAARAMGTQTLGGGASLIAPEYASEILDFLHPMAVVRSMGPSILPLNRGTLDQPYFNSAITASYVGDGEGANEGTPGDALLTFTRKTLQAIAALSKELMRESSYAVDVFLRRHMAAAMAAREDLAFIRGDGSQHSPKGLKAWAEGSSGGGDAHAFNSAGASLANITADVIKAMRVVEESKVPMINTGWLINVRDFYGLMKLRGATSELPIFPELALGNFYGHPIKKTTQIPKNLSTGVGNEGELYFAAFGSVAIAEAEGLELNAYDGGAYKDGTGTMQSGITNRQTVIEATAAHDFGCLYRGDEVALVKQVVYGV